MTEEDYIKYKTALGYEPSDYQSKFFDHVVHGSGNAVLDSYAGSGKTSTIIGAMRLIPNKKKCLFLAFNKSVADELKGKLADYPNCTVKTVHSLGLAILKRHYGSIDIDEYKYISYLRKNLSELSNSGLKDGREINLYVNRIISLLEFARQNLTQSKREIISIAKKYDINTSLDEVDVAHKLLKWGAENTNVIDYTDMVWLPNELQLDTKGNQYDWIFNDEAQDYSIAYVNLFRKCFKRGTRFVSCGDAYQSINQFAGASEDAFESMKKDRNTKVFKLPISYRCDRIIVEEARNIVSDFEYRNGADLGLIKHDSPILDIKGDDMVLCRTNAPLVKMFAKLIKNNVPCYIKGQDDDRNKLLATINIFKSGEALGKKIEEVGLFSNMYKDLILERNRLVNNGMNIADANNSVPVSNKYDTISTLMTIAAGCDTVSCLVEKIEKIFNQDTKGVCLSKIHNAKGLEANNVHILCRSTMPQKSAKTPSEIQQEQNLIYVAITRAKHKLCYVSEKEFPPMRSFDNEETIETEFKYIEKKVCDLYGIQPIEVMDDVELAKFRLKSASVMGQEHHNDNKKTITQPTIKKKSSLLDKLK